MVIISNGHSKFILATAAAEAYKRSLLDGFITAGYPTKKIKTAIKLLRLGQFRPMRRLIDREEALPEQLVRPIWTSELIGQASGLLRRVNATRGVAEAVENCALKVYGHYAAGVVEQVDSKIYHYRSGYGHESVQIAKRKGMIALCDHSIAHPALLEYLVRNGGHLPEKGYSRPISQFWRTVLQDINQADSVVVNSDFVIETFINQGWDPRRVHVAYTGVDDEFLNAIPERKYVTDPGTPTRLLFAGELSPRKGAEQLLEALERISDLQWRLEIVGELHPAIIRKFASFLKNERVALAGFIPRIELAHRMSAADVFLFPSLAEGSARVVFMALACGCYVVTTPNSGSIAVDGVHGALIPPGNVDALEAAIRRIIKNRYRVEQVGRSNAAVIRSRFRQTDYGDALFGIYTRLLTES
jgi:glycosyltransferase involved in cell wall biosynthesis